MVSAAGYSQLTRQHLTATPFPSPSSGTALLGPLRGFTCNRLIPATERAVWGSARRARKVADPLHMNLPFFGRAIVALDEIEHLPYGFTGRLQRFLDVVHGLGPRQATLFTSHTATSLFSVSWKQSQFFWTTYSHFNDLQFLNTTKLSVRSALAHIPHISHPNVLVSRLELKTES